MQKTLEHEPKRSPQTFMNPRWAVYTLRKFHSSIRNVPFLLFPQWRQTTLCQGVFAARTGEKSSGSLPRPAVPVDSEKGKPMRVRVSTSSPEFPDDGRQPPFTLRFTTDTSVPQSIVPIFFLHSFADPFCDNPLCSCQEQSMEKAALLARIARAEVALHRASGFDVPEGGMQ